MRRGSYHGFHVQTIRMTGYVGLLLTLIVLGAFLYHAWSHIRYFRGRPEWGYVLFVCTPFLIYPFYAMLVFGDYRFGFPRYFIMAGFLKMLWNIRHAEALELARTPRQALDGNASNPSPGARQEPPRGLPLPAMRTNPR